MTLTAYSGGATIVNRNKLAYAEQVIGQLPQLVEGVDYIINHYFAAGVYAREGVLRKDTVFVGRVHLQSQINILSKGDVTVLTQDGIKRYTAPCTWSAPKGTQRAAYTHEDTVWITILGTEEKDPDVIFQTCTQPNYDDFLAHEELLKIVRK